MFTSSPLPPLAFLELESSMERPWWSWLFFFFCRLWGHEAKMKSLTLLHQSDWTKSCCVLVLLLIVVFFKNAYEVWRIRQRIPHFLCGLSLLFRVWQVLEHPLFQISISYRKSWFRLRRMMLQWPCICLYLRPQWQPYQIFKACILLLMFWASFHLVQNFW